MGVLKFSVRICDDNAIRVSAMGNVRNGPALAGYSLTILDLILRNQPDHP
jgi:hypothetical protein